MHRDLEEYRQDIRMMLFRPSKSKSIKAVDETAMFFLYLSDIIVSCEWHWLKYLFSFIPPRPATAEIARVLAFLESMIPGVGKDFADRIGSFRNRNMDISHYDMLLQTMSEMLIIERLLRLNWSEPKSFQYEPKGLGGKRPELKVIAGDKQYLFEVKAPALTEHAKKRQVNEVQLPSRGLPLSRVDAIADRGLTLPRDNPVKDFLISANEKFAGFEKADGCNVLVVVWDDFIYEPIGALVNNASGLLTPNSFFVKDGEPVQFDSIDAVIVVRHLTYFKRGLAEENLGDGKASLFDFDGARALPNVIFPTPWGRPIPELIVDGFRALDYRNEILREAAEYQPIDMVFWIPI